MKWLLQKLMYCSSHLFYYEYENGGNSFPDPEKLKKIE